MLVVSPHYYSFRGCRSRRLVSGSVVKANYAASHEIMNREKSSVAVVAAVVHESSVDRIRTVLVPGKEYLVHE